MQKAKPGVNTKLKQTLLVFLVFPLLASSAASQVDQKNEAGESGVVIENNVSVKVNGEGKAHAKVKSEVNGQSVVVEIDEPGSLSVTTKNGQTTINSSDNLTPTIKVEKEENKEDSSYSASQNNLSTDSQTNYPIRLKEKIIAIKEKIYSLFKKFFNKSWSIFAK